MRRRIADAMDPQFKRGRDLRRAIHTVTHDGLHRPHHAAEPYITAGQ
ncbi:hypothetical protein [Arthrobacter sp. UYCo732]